MIAVVTIAGYFFLPIGLLLILTVEPRHLFPFWKKNRLSIDAATIMLVGVWWTSLSVALGPGPEQPALYQLCLMALFIGSAIYTCLLMYRANRDPRRPARTLGKRRTLATGLLFLLLGLFCAFDQSAEAYLDARHRRVELDREIGVAPVHLSAAREWLWGPRHNEGPGSKLPEPSIV